VGLHKEYCLTNKSTVAQYLIWIWPKKVAHETMIRNIQWTIDGQQLTQHTKHITQASAQFIAQVKWSKTYKILSKAGCYV